MEKTPSQVYREEESFRQANDIQSSGYWKLIAELRQLDKEYQDKVDDPEEQGSFFMSRRKAEFSYQDYQKILSRNVCEECGCGPDKDDPWQAHHKIWIEWGIQNGYPLEVLRHISNGALLHESCHNSLHNELDQPENRDIDFVLSQVAIQMKMF